MAELGVVRGSFDSMASVEAAARALKEQGVRSYEVYAPVLHHASMEEAMPRRGSFVRFFSTAGGLAGVAIGLGMCVLSSRLYNLVTGGKPPVSLVPFVVVGFECTILFACLATAASLVYFARLRPLAPPPEYDPAYSADRFGLHVRHEAGEGAGIAELLVSHGALEVVSQEAGDA
ncbi:MAG TPA: DUF3341 domain-containing protein [Armatimonadota bacterium]|jgi:molybdopterin-containing oxidoreductase family membrane subunit